MFEIMAKANVAVTVVFFMIAWFKAKDPSEPTTETLILLLPVCIVWFISAGFVLFTVGGA